MPFDACSAAVAGKASGEARRSSPEANLRKIQGILLTRLEDDKLTPTEIERITRGYIESEKLRRTINGLPANTSQAIKSEPKSRARKRLLGPIEEPPP